MGAIPTQRDPVSCAPDAPARGGPESLPAAPASAGIDRRAVAHVSLPSGPLAPGAARRFVGAALAEWAELDLPGARALSARLVEDAIVVVSELVTNAVVHAGTDVELLCRLAATPRPPPAGCSSRSRTTTPPGRYGTRAPSAPTSSNVPYGAAEYGRGLRLVAALSEAWGVTYRTGVEDRLGPAVGRRGDGGGGRVRGVRRW